MTREQIEKRVVMMYQSKRNWKVTEIGERLGITAVQVTRIAHKHGCDRRYQRHERRTPEPDRRQPIGPIPKYHRCPVCKGRSKLRVVHSWCERRQGLERRTGERREAFQIW